MIARLKTWALALSSALLAVGLAVLYGLRKGRQVQRQADAADQAKATIEAQQQTIHAHEVRNEVEAEVSKLPDAPPQKVGDARPDSAADRLQDWTRD